ncbi:MAG: hypothetical protein HYZ37_05530 [Candidatus Solibacter usitatus]|nr:hypothetical protein [Candidatus Solibacter usitatus]
MTRLLLAIGFATLLLAQKYTGPRPPKQDVLYLLHATNLVATDVSEAKEEKRKNDTVYAVDGASSNAKTPLAEPIFLLDSKTLRPERLNLYRLDVRNGRREVVMSNKRSQKQLHLTMKRLDNGLYRIEASEYLQNGEYGISPEGSNQVFLFQVY